MQKGTIQKVMDRGYGFIKPEDSDEDLFFHANELQNADFNSLQEGDAVEFEIAEGKDDDDGNPRQNAVNVNVVA
jgi:CspA family cold shock protein